MQNKKSVLPHVIFKGRDIPNNTETKFLDIYINENVKWNTQFCVRSRSGQTRF